MICCLRNLPAAIAAVDLCEIFDNSSARRPLRPLCRVVQSAKGSILTHLEIAPTGSGSVDPADIPVWWLEMLLEIKPDDPFTNGPL